MSNNAAVRDNFIMQNFEPKTLNSKNKSVLKLVKSFMKSNKVEAQENRNLKKNKNYTSERTSVLFTEIKDMLDDL